MVTLVVVVLYFLGAQWWYLHASIYIYVIVSCIHIVCITLWAPYDHNNWLAYIRQIIRVTWTYGHFPHFHLWYILWTHTLYSYISSIVHFIFYLIFHLFPFSSSFHSLCISLHNFKLIFIFFPSFFIISFILHYTLLTSYSYYITFHSIFPSWHILYIPFASHIIHTLTCAHFICLRTPNIRGTSSIY